MIHVGDIKSTVGVFSTVGYSKNKRPCPHGTEHPPVLMISPYLHHDIPHGTEDLMVIHTPTVLQTRYTGCRLQSYLLKVHAFANETC